MNWHKRVNCSKGIRLFFSIFGAESSEKTWGQVHGESAWDKFVMAQLESPCFDLLWYSTVNKVISIICLSAKLNQGRFTLNPNIYLLKCYARVFHQRFYDLWDFLPKIFTSVFIFRLIHKIEIYSYRPDIWVIYGGKGGKVSKKNQNNFQKNSIKTKIKATIVISGKFAFILHFLFICVASKLRLPD